MGKVGGQSSARRGAHGVRALPSKTAHGLNLYRFLDFSGRVAKMKTPALQIVNAGVFDF